MYIDAHFCCGNLRLQLTCLNILIQVVAGVKKIETKTIDSSMEKIGEDGQVCTYEPTNVTYSISYYWFVHFRKEK